MSALILAVMSLATQPILEKPLSKITGSSYLTSLRAELPVCGRDIMDAKFKSKIFLGRV